MKHIISLLTVSALLFIFSAKSIAQDVEVKSGIGFYFNPHYSAMFLDDHVGNAFGFNIGISSKNRKWTAGIRFYSRSGPINEGQEYDLVLADGQTYKGKSVLKLGADHGYVGVEIAYSFRASDDKILVRIPVSMGQVGAGFYLKGEDRITPDGRRVRDWEDDLQEGNDAGFGAALELGVEVFYSPFEDLPYIAFGGGAHYTKTFGYESFIGGDDYLNNKIRISAGMYFSF